VTDRGPWTEAWRGPHRYRPFTFVGLSGPLSYLLSPQRAHRHRSELEHGGGQKCFARSTRELTPPRTFKMMVSLVLLQIQLAILCLWSWRGVPRVARPDWLLTFGVSVSVSVSAPSSTTTIVAERSAYLFTDGSSICFVAFDRGRYWCHLRCTSYSSIAVTVYCLYNAVNSFIIMCFGYDTTNTAI